MNFHVLKTCHPVFLALLLSGCYVPAVTELRNPLQDDYSDVSFLHNKNLPINSTHVAVGTKAHKSLDYAQAGQNQAGLLGFFITAALTSGTNDEIQDTQRSIQPVRNAILKYNYGSRLRSAVEQSLADIHWLKVSYVGKYPALQHRNVEQLFSQNRDDTLFIVDSSYSFSEDFNAINVYCYATIHSRNKARFVSSVERPDDRLIYQKKFSYSYSLGPAYQDTGLAISKWSENDGQVVVAALDEALTDITKRLSADIKRKRY